MPAKRADVSAELRGPFLILFLVIPILAIAGFEVYEAVKAASSYQREIRSIEKLRVETVVGFLDEETGIRGYTATGDAAYLGPYDAARATVPAAMRRLASELQAHRFPAAAALVADEQRLNERWIAEVADPLQAAPPRSPAGLAIQRTGKSIVDRFRRDDAALQSDLASAADVADTRTNRAFSTLLIFVISAVSLLTLGATAFGFFQARAARRAFEARVLYENQKRIADELQTAFLNTSLPGSAAIRMDAIYRPATAEAQVGGDWYDAFELPDKRILFSIGDVAGHGLQAALAMSRARQAIVAAALHENDPAQVLVRANAAIMLQGSPMVTAICGYIDPLSFAITYATAGHPPPILAHPGVAAVLLAHDGVPLGIEAAATYTTFTATAGAGAVLVLYTDGVIEFERDVIGGEARLLDAARLAVAAADPASAIERTIFAAHPPTDDVAILTVTFAPVNDPAAGEPDGAPGKIARRVGGDAGERGRATLRPRSAFT
jgi:CHASE3 domain sensor protein